MPHRSLKTSVPTAFNNRWRPALMAMPTMIPSTMNVRSARSFGKNRAPRFIMSRNASSMASLHTLSILPPPSLNQVGLGPLEVIAQTAEFLLHVLGAEGAGLYDERRCMPQVERRQGLQQMFMVHDAIVIGQCEVVHDLHPQVRRKMEMLRFCQAQFHHLFNGLR